jgi:hypothetical protein
MTTNSDLNHVAVTLRGYRLPRPTFTTWTSLLQARDFLREQVGLKLGEQIDLIETDPESLQAIRTWMQVSDRHKVTRREIFQWVKHAHESSQWLGNWAMILHVYPVIEAEAILIRIESGAILDKWFEWFIDDMVGEFHDFSYPTGNALQDTGTEALWNEQMTLTPTPYRLIVCDDLQEFASTCV